MTRRRLTWNGRMASAPPAMPGYQDPYVHPPAYPDPEADAYENGDTSSWAEDPHPGPYPNTFHPALPGTEEPMGHPATDPAHYFPAGVTKQASRQLRAAMEVKAAKCIRIAQSMLGRKASVSAIEDQALDLMNLTERQIAAALKRIADDDGMAQDVPTEASMDLLAIENMTLTPPRQADDEQLLEAMLSEEQMGGDEGHMSDEAILSHMIAEEKAKMSMHMASRKRAFGAYDKMPGDQNAPDHYNFRAEGVLASKKSDDADVEAEEMLAEMVKEEKKASLRRQAKKSEDTEADEVEADEETTEAEEAPAKKAAHFQRLAAYWARVAKKSEEETEADEDTTEAEEEPKEEAKADKKASARKAAIRRLAGLELSADVKEALAALLKAEDVEPVAGEELVAADDAEPTADDAEPTADDFLMDDMGLDPMLMDDGMGGDELSMLYGGRVAKKSEETTEAEAEEKAEGEDAEAPKAEKKAAVRPQPRKASNGPKTLGSVAKVASSDVNDLSKLWESAPDVSKIFG